MIFEIAKRGGQDEELLCVSDTATSCRRSPGYKSGYQKKITPQLGFSFLYDATRETEPTDLHPAAIVEKNCTFYPRPVQKLEIGERAKAKIIAAAENGAYYLIDLGKESVGLPHLNFLRKQRRKLPYFGAKICKIGTFGAKSAVGISVSNTSRNPVKTIIRIICFGSVAAT